MALLLLLVAVMVSAVIIASAVSGAMTVKSDRLQQQAYLTVSSAAKLMRDDLANCGYTSSVTTTYSSQSDRKNGKNGTGSVPKITSGGTGIFTAILQSAISSAQNNEPYSKSFTICADGFDDVTAEITLKKDTKKDVNGNTYNLTVWFTGGTVPNECRMCLTAQGNITSDTKDSGYSWSWEDWKTYYFTNTTTKVSWSLEKLQKEVTQ